MNIKNNLDELLFDLETLNSSMNDFNERIEQLNKKIIKNEQIIKKFTKTDSTLNSKSLNLEIKNVKENSDDNSLFIEETSENVSPFIEETSENEKETSVNVSSINPEMYIEIKRKSSDILHKIPINENGDVLVKDVNAIFQNPVCLSYQIQTGINRVCPKKENIFVKPEDGWKNREYTVYII